MTLSILYSDGDREDGAKPAHVRRVGPSRADVVKTPSATQLAPEKPTETPPLPVADTASATATSARPPAAADKLAPASTPSAPPAAAPTVNTVVSDAIKDVEPAPAAATPAAVVVVAPAAVNVPIVVAPVASAAETAPTSIAPSHFASTHAFGGGDSARPFGLSSTPATAAAHSAVPSARSTPARAPALSESQLFGTPLSAAAPAASLSASFAPTPVSLAHLGRLARELGAVRVRARPAISDAFSAQAAARSLSTSGARGGGGDAAPLTASHVAAWVVSALARAQARVGGAAAVQLTADIEVVSTAALREGLLACGFPTSTESLAVLRSAFRARPELGAGFLFPLPHGSKTALRRASTGTSPRGSARAGEGGSPSGAGGTGGAAILVGPLVSFLVGDDTIAAEILKRVDDMALRRSGSGRSRPPCAPAAAPASSLPWELGAGSLAASVVLGGSAATTSAGQRGLVTPHRTALSASVLDAAPRAAAAATLHAPLSTNVREWLRTRATDEERQNLVALMGLIADFQTKNRLPAVAVSAAHDGSDTVVVPLGNTLKVGLRVYT